ncbi:iron ABC transporter permease [Ahrensia kielensis]|uniref:Iron ABC transporter permease n=1 Tax=Ahrensia kielensis TaxID=76980 RepID=A0ABU9T234_9HYPH
MSSDVATPHTIATIEGGDRTAFARLSLIVLALALLATAIFSLASGATNSSAFAVAWALLSGDDSAIDIVERIVILDIRMPRTLLGMMIGASLAVSGAIMQGLFRNPLADPGIVGVSAGAGLGAVTAIVLGGTVLAPLGALFGIYQIPLAAFLGGLASTFILYRVSTSNGRTSVATMLLTGIALGAMTGAFTGLLVFWADDQQLRDLTFWGLGSVAGATWIKVAAVAPIILPIIILAPIMARGLNAMTLGEATAQHLGINVQLFKRVAIVAVAGATGASVAVSGGIGFVGIVVPHLLRLFIGPDHKYLLPACALLGAIMLLLADAIARQIVAPAELPIGIVTATIGAPFFLWILLRKRGLLDM